MIAAIVFVFAEAGTVAGHWKTSLQIDSLVTLLACVHYMYMLEDWVQVRKSPVVYRYIDCTITVPLIEFNLILKAAKAPISPMGFRKLLIGTVAMLALGYAGEIKVTNPWVGFTCYACQDGSVPEAVKGSFNYMRVIVSVNWNIYPLGYYFGVTSGVDTVTLNVIYNPTD